MSADADRAATSAEATRTVAAEVDAVQARAIGRQATMNVGSVLLTGGYTIWLTSFLVGQLGPETYGAWVTIVAILTPLLVLDAGLGLLVVRAAAGYSTRKVDAVIEVTAAHGLYLGLGMIGLALGVVLGLVPGQLLGLSDGEADQARVAAWILAFDFALVIGTSALPGLLRGHRRFDAIFAASSVQVATGVGLTLVLVPTMGLVGAAAAQLASRGAGRLVQLFLVSRLVPWFSVRPHLPDWAYLRTVLRFSGPLVVISIASQISFSTDVLVVGALVGASAASAVAIGARLPVLAVSMLSIATDVVFPVFVQDEEGQQGRPSAIVWRALLAAGFMGGCAFLFLASARQEILDIWVPGVDPVASTVFAIYCATWAIHLPAHILSLALVAHDRHAILAPIVLAESVVNLILSVGFVLALGPFGAAIGSFIAVGISNGLVLPLVTQSKLGLRAGRVLMLSAIGLLLGATVAALGWMIVEVVGLSGPMRLATQAVVTAAAGGLCLVALWSHGPPLTGRRVTSIP